MAYSRRNVTCTFAHLSRRLHPSFAHILPNNPNHGEHPLPSPPPPSQPPAFSRSIPNLSSPFHHALLLPLRLNPSPHRFYSSTSDEVSNETEIMHDVANVLTDTTIDTAISAVPAPFAGEVAAAAADSYLPVAALQHLIDGVQSFTGLNWWLSIVLTTILIRGATIPLLLNTMRATVKLNMMRPELEELKQDMQNSMDPESLQEGQKRMKALFAKHGVTPFTPLKGLFIQGPIFISFFLAISNMVEKVPSFKGGGAFWFTDLTTPDPMYMLPVLTSLTFLATVELNMQEGMEGNPMVNTMKNFSRILALMTIPFTAHFPKAIFCYWITSNIFSLLYGFTIRRSPVRKFLNLPDLVPEPANSSPPSNISLFGGFKPTEPTPPPASEKEPEQAKTPGRRISSSSVISLRIRNLEKSVKARSKLKKR